MIFTIRGQRVMIERDLAKLYGVETKRLNEAVKRNIKRFPADFMFQLTDEEFKNLKSQIATSSWGGVRKLPYAFTEHGVTMLASILNSDKAIEISVQVVRAFVQLRQYAISQTAKTKEIEDLRRMLMLHIENYDNKFNENDKQIAAIVTALNNLIDKPKEHKKIGF